MEEDLAKRMERLRAFERDLESAQYWMTTGLPRPPRHRGRGRRRGAEGRNEKER